MRFLVDECTGTKVASWLREQGYEVFSVYEQARGISDNTIIRKAFAENWILITYVCCSRTTKNFVFKLDWRSLVLLKLFS